MTAKSDERLRQAAENGFLMCDARGRSVRGRYWRFCKEHRIPYAVCYHGSKRAAINIDMDPLYSFGGRWQMSDAQVQFIFSLCRKYKAAGAAGGATVIVIKGMPVERAGECMREIVHCLKEKFQLANKKENQ